MTFITAVRSLNEQDLHGESGGVYATLQSGTLYPNGLTETGLRPGVWLSNKPKDLSAFVSEEHGHGKGGGMFVTVLSYTLYPNGRTGTGVRFGVWLCNKPKDLSAFVSEERGHGDCACVRGEGEGVRGRCGLASANRYK